MEREWHYMCTSIGSGFYVFDIIITTVAVNAYNLDSYAEGSCEVAARVNFCRTRGGFIVSCFQALAYRALFALQHSNEAARYISTPHKARTSTYGI
ncbi:hypothetical protein V1517DRAFT_328205 [Lipomyces orientalis]|uniref:Uncharacterized protein n=1 Tax=Lipomyces orientalis TaxID=1233043 RepID=A0ACC3TJD6_9ASCO